MRTVSTRKRAPSRAISACSRETDKRSLAAEGKAPEGSVALLRDAASGAAGPLLVRVAQALRVLTGDESWADPIVSVLASDLGERVRDALDPSSKIYVRS